MSATRLSIPEAKERLDVAALWPLLKLPGELKRLRSCPFHGDRSASFSIFTGNGGALRWKCFAGCGGGGPVELLAVAEGISERDACRRLVELAGGDAVPDTATVRAVAPKPMPPRARRLILPVGMHRGSHADLQALATLRGLSLAGIELADARGLVRFAPPRGCRSYIVTDRARVNAQARRMDGGLWAHIGNKKAWTLPGSRAAWPIGTHEAAAFPFVALVEGSPDLLAGHHFVTTEGREADVAVVAVLGAANAIPDDALAILAGKRIRIYPHADPAGRKAAVRWCGQLECVSCVVDAFRFDGLRRADGGAVGDLNDLANMDADAFEAERNELSEVLPR